jgi:hypothetical protein
LKKALLASAIPDKEAERIISRVEFGEDGDLDYS